MGELLFSHPIALVALVVGYVLLVVEMCIPGFGVPGVLGAILSVLGVIAMQPSPMQALLLVAVFVALLLIALAICLRSASKGRLSKSRLVLNEVATQPSSHEGDDMSYFVGKLGFAHTPLRPAGIAEFDGVKLSVVSGGNFVEKDVPVKVERVEGKHIIVSAIERQG